VAYRWLVTGGKARLWQGPVYKVRNFYSLGPITKIAALYQALAHEWYYPALMQRLPFIGGTNFYATRELLEQIGGFDAQALTEDLEIGARAYLAADAWPEYIPYFSTEQTPATLRAFFRQRLRWASGHLQVVEKFRQATIYPSAKRRQLVFRLFVKGQLEWSLYQAACLLPVVLRPLNLSGQIDIAYGLPAWVGPWLRLNAALYYGFTFYLYWRYRHLMDANLAPCSRLSLLAAPLELIFLPLAGFFFPVPYTVAMLLKFFGRQPQTWVKTPRTREAVEAPPVVVRTAGQLAMGTGEASRRS
jgi:cellulose synthase/poly-beta-1,6-N-acetylglucosamine synthase-like glycosyltransferase